MKRMFLRWGAVVAAAVAGLSLLQAPASAAGRDVGTYVSAEPCSWICLHYRVWSEGARWTASNPVSEFTTHSFVGTSAVTRGHEGAGQQIRNNAASINNKTGVWVTVFYSPGFNGNYDYIGRGMAGNLYYTANDNASIVW